MSKKSKKSPTPVQPKVEASAEKQPEKEASTSKAPSPVVVKQEKPLTLHGIQKELESVRQLVSDHASQIASLQDALAKKRRPTSNGKVQILDKATGEVYPSKNNAYQTLLKSGDLKELVDKGVFGPDPEKNTFGWYALVRAWPDRFEEKKVEESAASK